MGDSENQFTQWFQNSPYQGGRSSNPNPHGGGGHDGFTGSGGFNASSPGGGFNDQGGRSSNPNPHGGGGHGGFTGYGGFNASPPGGGFNASPQRFGFSQFSQSASYQRFSPSPSPGPYSHFSPSPSPGPFDQFSMPPDGYRAFESPPENQRFRSINLNDDDDEEEEEEEGEEEEEEEGEPAPPPPRRKGKQPAAAAKKKGGVGSRGANYTADEIEWLAKCYIDIGTDPEKANYQDRVQFWERIAQRFNAFICPTNPRETGPIKSAWTRAKKEIGDFNSCYLRLERENASGRNDLDLYTLAEDAYVATRHKDFKWRKAWEVLRNVPTYTHPEKTTQPKRTKINRAGGYTSNSTDAETNDERSAQTRPLGQKSSRRKGKSKLAEEAKQFMETVATELHDSNQQSDFKMAYEIYTRKESELEPEQLEKHRRVCAMLEKKWGF